MRGIWRQVLLVGAAAFNIGVNLFFGSNGASGGSSNSSIYDTYPTAVSPLPYTFAVWAPIFIGTIALAIYQALPRKQADHRLDAIAIPLTLAYIFNGLSAFTPITISGAAIVAILLSLLATYLVLIQVTPQDTAFVWFVRIPIVIFFGWITVATIVNLSQVLVFLGWSGFGLAADVWGALLIGVATAIGLVITFFQREVAYAVVLIWAFWGVFAAHPTSTAILWSAIIATVMLVVVSIIALMPGSNGKQPTIGLAR